MTSIKRATSTIPFFHLVHLLHHFHTLPVPLYFFSEVLSQQLLIPTLSMSEGSENHPGNHGTPLDISMSLPTSPHARVKRRITTLMDKVEILKQDKATKQRFELS
jgi:hypothetical protein